MKRAVLHAALALAVVTWAFATDAHAYPQFQMDREQTCTGCHVSPAGGGILNENGLNVAQSMAMLESTPEFFYGKIPTPSWLTLGGDLRSATGYMHTPTNVLTYFPMQIEAYANATFSQFTIHANVGFRPRQEGNEAVTTIWSREHYVMWQQKPGETEGVYARLGRFLPVYGLRLAEHPAYTRRFGPTPLYAESYGVHAALIKRGYEGHLTAFVRDPLIDPVDHSNGAMAYVEVRPTERLSVGAQGMLKRSKDDTQFGGGVTSKVYVPAAKLLLQAELQYANQIIDKSPLNAAGGAPLKLIAYLMGSISPTDSVMLDIGLGHYDSNFRIKNLDRDCVDVNLHLFLDSHLELLWTNRYETIAFGKGGPASGYSLLQFHYRL